MSDVLNRTTFEYRKSVHSPDYPVTDWIHNPDMSLVENEADQRKWIVVGDTIRLKNPVELDQAIELFRNDALRILAESVQAFGGKYYPLETEMRLKVLYQDALGKGLVNRQAKIGQALGWEQTLTMDYMTRRAQIMAATTVADIEAVSTDFSNNTPATVVTVPEALEIPD